MQLYTNTEEANRTDTAQITGPLPSLRYGEHDHEFKALATLERNKEVTSHALPEYSHPDAFPPALVMALTQELNHGALDPKESDAISAQEFETVIRNLVSSMCKLCPSLRSQFERLGDNRLQSHYRTASNNCWNCGKPGHVRAHCPQLRLGARRYATDPPLPRK
jgi:hypothetical protein